MGSTRDARRAGRYAANMVTTPMNKVATATVIGSDGLRPKSWLCTRRPAARVREFRP